MNRKKGQEQEDEQKTEDQMNEPTIRVKTRERDEAALNDCLGGAAHGVRAAVAEAGIAAGELLLVVGEGEAALYVVRQLLGALVDLLDGAADLILCVGVLAGRQVDIKHASAKLKYFMSGKLAKYQDSRKYLSETWFKDLNTVLISIVITV